MLGLSGCVTTAGGKPSYYFENFDLTPPRGNVITVCHGYGCRFETPYDMSGEDLDYIAAVMAKAEQSAAGERAAVAKVITYMENRVGAKIGTDQDRAGIEAGGIGDPTQLDCIDETANTTSVLMIMERHRLLKYHTVRKPQVRGYWVDGRWPHWTAVLTVKEDGVDWVMDPWFRDNGVPPVVMPLEDWYSYEEDADATDAPYQGIVPRTQRRPADA